VKCLGIFVLQGMASPGFSGAPRMIKVFLVRSPAVESRLCRCIGISEYVSTVPYSSS